MQIENVSELLISKGIRPTTHRVQIAEYIFSKDQHFTADNIVQWADANLEKVSKATIYNTLNEFAKVGLLNSFLHSESSSAVFDSNTNQHFHIYDSEAKEYIDIDSSMVLLKSDLYKQYDIESVEVVIKGKRKN